MIRFTINRGAAKQQGSTNVINKESIAMIAKMRLHILVVLLHTWTLLFLLMSISHAVCCPLKMDDNEGK